MNESSNEKTILDCGAGGRFPKLALFYYHGYKTYGIEISEERINWADEYSQNKNITLNIKKGDMRYIEFDSNSFGFTYTYNTIFHLTKKETKIALDEMFRVLKKNGLLFVNLLSVEDSFYGDGKEVRPGEFVKKYDDEEVLHCFYKDNEADIFFKYHKIIYKEKKRVFINDVSYLPGMLDYIVKKQ